MIPKFRAFVKKENKLFETDDLLLIDFLNEEVMLQQNSIIYATSFDFDEVVLMQSTGLKDKNGKEIFEGDVIAIEVDDTGTPINARVFQNSKIGVLMFHVFEDNEDVPMVELLEDNSVAFEIIGNIYENPELLEEK